MLISKTRWDVNEYKQIETEKIASSLNISSVVAGLLIDRGYEDPDSAKRFLYYEGQDFYDPFLISDMEKAVDRIKLAVANKERILIMGDYDADGVTSTALMLTILRKLKAEVDYYIPNRFTEGYGPNEGAIRRAQEAGITLIITVDAGITSIDEAKVARDLGIDMIITDHHEAKENLPEAYAIIHPSLADSDYPFAKLAGVGVAFKLAHALIGKVPEDVLDLVAIGTVADLVPLLDENRFIVKEGLRRITEINRLGLRELCKVADVNFDQIDAESIAFMIGPRLNAVGRLDQADRAVELLLAKEPAEAAKLAEEINDLNKERQDLVNKITEEAIILAEQEVDSGAEVIVVGSKNWHEGVVGIVASRLVEHFNRPAIILKYNQETGLAKGSGRSIPKFNLFENLSESAALLERFGGHPMAAGLTMEINKVEELRDALSNLLGQQLTKADLIPVTKVDLAIDLQDASLKTIEELSLLEPYGMDNPKPKLQIDQVGLKDLRPVGADKSHLKLTLQDDDGELDGIAFRKGNLFNQISQESRVSVIGELSINEWNNIKKPQIIVEDIAITDWQLFDLRGTKHFSELDTTIPKSERKFIVFRKDTIDEFGIPDSEEVVLVSSLEEAEDISLSGDVIIVDLPSSMPLFERLINNKSCERIYLCLFTTRNSFFSTRAGREDFKWYYGFLLQNSPFNLANQINALAKHKDWSVEMINFMTEVFLELDFIEVNNGRVNVNRDAEKRDLRESNLYNRRANEYLVEERLLYSTYNNLKNIFVNNKVISKYEEVTP